MVNWRLFNFRRLSIDLLLRAFPSTILKNLAFTISKTNFIIYNISLYNILSIKTFRFRLVCEFKHMFSVFKQYYTYFLILFHPCISKNIENCYLNTYQTSPYFFYIPFKYSFIIIFYSFFIFPLSLLCLSLSQPNYSQHRRPSHPPTHTTTTTSTHHRCHQPLATNQINRNHNNSKGKKKKRKTSTSTYTVGLKKKNQWQSDQITTNHSKKKRRKTHKPWPNRTTNQINQIGPQLLRSMLQLMLHGWPPSSVWTSTPPNPDWLPFP